MAKRKRPASFGTDKSLEEQFLASLEDWFPEDSKAGTPLLSLEIEREVQPAWTGKRKFRFDFRLSHVAWPYDQSCLVEIQGGGGARGGAHATITGRGRDYAKLALSHWGEEPLFMFNSPQVKSGEAAEIVAAWLRGHEAPACLTEPPRATKAARKAKRLARPRAKKARLKRAA